MLDIKGKPQPLAAARVAVEAQQGSGQWGRAQWIAQRRDVRGATRRAHSRIWRVQNC